MESEQAQKFRKMLQRGRLFQAQVNMTQNPGQGLPLLLMDSEQEAEAR